MKDNVSDTEMLHACKLSHAPDCLYQEEIAWRRTTLSTAETTASDWEPEDMQRRPSLVLYISHKAWHAECYKSTATCDFDKVWNILHT